MTGRLGAGIDEGWRTAGLSCASFFFPDSKKMTLMAGSALDIAERDVQNMRQKPTPAFVLSE